jgi:hypothetical protein
VGLAIGGWRECPLCADGGFFGFVFMFVDLRRVRCMYLCGFRDHLVIFMPPARTH